MPVSFHVTVDELRQLNTSSATKSDFIVILSIILNIFLRLLPMKLNTSYHNARHNSYH